MDDLISRKDLMKKIAHHTVHDSMSYVTFERSTVYEMVKGDMFGLVKDAPAVDAIPRWINVEERLPEHMDDVLVWVGGLVEVGCYDESNECWELYTYVGDGSVTHWMPLPEPPEEAP